jgi:two-component SAPR family response regulator
MNIIALDDENLALEGILSQIRKVTPGAEINGFLLVEPAIDYARNNKVDVAFLDIEMYDINGIEVAKQLKEIHPDINIIFSTGYKKYMEEAFSLYASDYITKPATEDKVREQLSNLRHPIEESAPKIEIKTFGKFEVFVNGLPLKFSYSKAKELLAILVDREGRMCTVGELMGILWEDEDDLVSRTSYMRNLQSDLSNVFKKNGIEDVLIKQRGSLAIDSSKVKCDLFDFLKGGAQEKSAFHGEYMSQYSWGEDRISVLEEEKSRS